MSHRAEATFLNCFPFRLILVLCHLPHNIHISMQFCSLRPSGAEDGACTSILGSRIFQAPGQIGRVSHFELADSGEAAEHEQ